MALGVFSLQGWQCNIAVLRIGQGRCFSSHGRTTRGAEPIRANDDHRDAVLKTGSDCQLAVAFYPIFLYDASSGSVYGTAQQGEDGKVWLEFDASEVYIPPLEWKTTRVLGVPIPPPLKIEIETKKLVVCVTALTPRACRKIEVVKLDNSVGWMDESTGQAELEFDALFKFTAGSIYQPPALKVTTLLSTEGGTGKFRSADGERFSKSGAGKLVGIAKVPKTEDTVLDTFLQLPSEAFALLSASLVV